MTSPVLVTGGTGLIGRLVVRRLRDTGRDVRVLSRHGPESAYGTEHVTADLLGGQGIEPAVRGVDTVLHPAGGPEDSGSSRSTRTRWRLGRWS